MISKEIMENLYPLINVKIGNVLQKSGKREVCELSAKEGNFVVKMIDQYKAEERIKRDTFVFNFLEDINFPYIPKLLKTKLGESYAIADDRFFYVMEKIIGKTPERNPESYKKLAEIAVEIHTIPNYPNETFFNIPTELKKLQETANKFPFAEEFRQIANALPDFKGLSASFIHSDIGTHNAVQKEDGTIIFTDWDDAGVGTTILDLGFPLICLFIDNNDLIFQEDNAKEFYETYFSNRKITDKEKSLIFDAGLFFALMYTEYGEVEKNWERVKFAVKNKELISSFCK